MTKWQQAFVILVWYKRVFRGFHVYFGGIYISYPFSLASLVFGCVIAD